MLLLTGKLGGVRGRRGGTALEALEALEEVLEGLPKSVMLAASLNVCTASLNKALS